MGGITFYIPKGYFDEYLNHNIIDLEAPKSLAGDLEALVVDCIF